MKKKYTRVIGSYRQDDGALIYMCEGMEHIYFMHETYYNERKEIGEVIEVDDYWYFRINKTNTGKVINILQGIRS